MAAIIKRSHLGSGPPPREHTRPDTIRLRSTEFRSTGRTLEQAGETFVRNSEREKAAREAEYESNAEVQRRRQMHPEDKARESIDRMIPKAKELIQMRTGQEASDDQARAYGEGLANKLDHVKEDAKK